jgi:hypothetical protein
MLSMSNWYNTRNKIVHWGASVEIDKDKMIEVSQDGAKIALKSALSVFMWLQINRYDRLIEVKFATFE